MLSFQLDVLSSKELYKDVFVRLVNGDELTLNYFELKSASVAIPLHEHPVEHLVVVLEGEVEFVFEGHRLSVKERNGMHASWCHELTWCSKKTKRVDYTSYCTWRINWPAVWVEFGIWFQRVVRV